MCSSASYGTGGGMSMEGWLLLRWKALLFISVRRSALSRFPCLAWDSVRPGADCTEHINPLAARPRQREHECVQNDRVLGLLQASGLAKKQGLCWAVALAEEGDCVRVERSDDEVLEPVVEHNVGGGNVRG